MRKARGITEAEIRAMKVPEGKRWVRLYDGNGLFIYRLPSGVRRWKLRYHLHGKERWLTLGEWPAMSLKEARRAASEARNAIYRGHDPSIKPLVFREIALLWMDHMRSEKGWTEKTHATKKQWLEDYVFPILGDSLVSDIRPPQITNLVKSVAAKGRTYSAHRILGMLKSIYAFAIAHGYASSDPTEKVTPTIAGLPSLKKTRQNYPAFTEEEQVGALMRAIEGYPNLIVRGALKMLALTLARPGEVRTMRWQDIDRKRKQWRYVVTKTNTPHVVPLSRQAMAILDELEPITGNGELVFPGFRPGRPLSNNTLNAALRSMGIDTRREHCAHGFRAMGRSLLAELGFRPEAIERQLCHKQPDDTVAAYAREKLIKERTQMMQAWADYLDTLRRRAAIKVVA